MNKIIYSLFIILLLCIQFISSLETKTTKTTLENAKKSPIKHLVVLMLENRSFDHMCGYLKQTYNSSINGLTGTESNPIDPSDPSKGIMYVNDKAVYVDPDPSHSIDGTTLQVFGGLSQQVEVAPMNGFVASAIKTQIPKETVMSCFTETNVPTISTLAKEFGLFDSWHADVPGPTEVNRMYVQSATSHGAGTNDDVGLALGYPQKTIYQSLYENNKTFDIFFTDFPTGFFLRKLRFPPYLSHFHLIENFEKHVNEGKLGDYTFLEPRYFTVDKKYPAQDQHPDHDVVEGELLMQKMYSILRNGPNWNETAFLITYDEHGGFYDHSPTPLQGIPNPDGLVCKDPDFNFTRLGVRVPSILISPWVNKGTIISKSSPENTPTNTSTFSHSSVPATIKKLFELNSDFLTKRDEWASTFDDVFLKRTEPRTDCPTSVPAPPVGSIRSLLKREIEKDQPMNGLQKGFVQVAKSLGGASEEDANKAFTEKEGGLFVMKNLQKYFTEKIQNSEIKFRELNEILD